jgi:hypothetical protein
VTHVAGAVLLNLFHWSLETGTGFAPFADHALRQWPLRRAQ